MRCFSALAAGLLFGAGLVISGMINPAKVLAFLDVTGDWDPSLAFVMIGAIPVAAIGFSPLLPSLTAAASQPPAKRAVDLPLIVGAVLFGIGWGLAGFCPGPALAALGFQRAPAVLFVAAMLAGMAAFRIVASLLAPNTAAPTQDRDTTPTRSVSP